MPSDTTPTPQNGTQDVVFQPVEPQKGRDPLADEVIIGWNAGMGRNQLARTLGITRYRVSKIAQDHGLEFNADHTAEATAARIEHARRDRVELEHRWQSFAHRCLDHAEDATSPDDVWMWVRTGAVATDKATALAAHLANDSTSDETKLEEGRKAVGIHLNLMMTSAEKARKLIEEHPYRPGDTPEVSE